MQSKDICSPKTGDWIALLGVLLLAGGLALFLLFGTAQSDQTTVRILQDGEFLAELPLNSDATFDVSGQYENTVEIRHGKVSVTHATCPGRDCVHSGAISRIGGAIFCIPNRLEIRLSGKEDLDIVTG